MSRASAQRIVEVLDETSDLMSPEAPVKEIRDGSVDFDDLIMKTMETIIRLIRI